jgi:HAD superfamily hydrolase (TIGR01509 family)
MRARPGLVLFDLDGVLADYDRSARCQAMADAVGTNVDAMFEAMFGDAGFEHLTDRGEIGLDGSLAGLRERHGWDMAAADFLDARRLGTRVRPAMLDLCRQVQAQARIAMFTNNGDWVLEHIDTIAPGLRPLFGDSIMCSGVMKASKPDPQAFLACLRRLRHEPPADTLFIDDNADNVAGASRAGLDALLFTDPATLRAELRARGFHLQGDSDAS